MGAVRTQKRWAQSAHHKVPSFVFRQDGCELSYEIVAIIAKKQKKVKNPDQPKKKTCFIKGCAPVTGSISMTMTSFIYLFHRSTTGLSACTFAANSTLSHS